MTSGSLRREKAEYEIDEGGYVRATVALVRHDERLRARTRGLAQESRNRDEEASVAQVQTVQLIDDLTGGQADETVEFGLDGKRYEIELAADNAQGLREALAEYIAGARRQRGEQQRRVRGAQRPTVDREQNQAIRAWARARGMKVSDRGRISAEIMTAYHERSAR